MRGAAVMPRGIMAFPLLAVGLGGVALALLLGGRAVTTTETEVIERVAALYQNGRAGADRSDCQARPAQSEGLWLVIICEARSGTGVAYFIDRFGRVADTRRLEGEA